MSSTSKKRPDLTIVIPAYREEKRIGKTLNELAAFLKSDSYFKNKVVEVIVVSADAPDRTHEIVESKSSLFQSFRFIKSGRKIGKGNDVKIGMQAGSGHYIIYMDADLATPLSHLQKFYETCKGGQDIVIGSRNLKKHHYEISRRVISRVGSILFRAVSRTNVKDSMCGFKMFNRKANKICFSKLTLTGWCFDMELLTIAKVNNLSINSQYIVDWVDVPMGTFNKNLIKVVWVSLIELFKILYRRINGSYKV